MLFDIFKINTHNTIDSQFILDYNKDMLLSQKQTIEDYVVESLANNDQLSGPELLESIQKKRVGTTKQAMYSVLEFLLQDEIVAKIGTKYYLSKIWLDRLTTLLRIDTKRIEQDPIFTLGDKESVSYKFSNLHSCDTYWAHLFKLLIEWIAEDVPICVWNPHEWFAIGRYVEEKEIFTFLEKQNKKALYTISGNTSLDRSFKRDFSTKVLRINTGNNLGFKQNYYLNIFNDYIIEVFLDDELTRKIEQFYQDYKELTEENISEFENLIAQKYSIRMKVSKNKEKSAKLRKRLSKDFYI